MAALPRLTQADIKAHIPNPYFERGLNYYRNSQITDTVRRGDHIEGDCEGSAPEPYHVSVEFDDDTIVGDSCSCPMGGGCKHVAALLLAWAHTPKTFAKREAVSTALDSKSKEELVALVQEMLKREPDLKRLVDMPMPGQKGARRPKADPEIYRRQVRYAMRDSDDWHAVRGIAREISAVVDIGDKFAEQNDWENAQVVYQAVMDEGLKDYLNTHDEGDIAGEIQRAVEGLTYCLAARVADPVARRGLLRTLFNVIEWDINEGGGLDMDYGAKEALNKHATPEDRRDLREWISKAVGKKASGTWGQQAWGKLLADFTDKDDVESFLKQARKQGLYRSLFEKLVELKRVDEALEVARQHLATSGWERLQCAEFLDKAKFPNQALALAEAGLPDKDDRLAAWVAQHYAQRGDAAKALELNLARWHPGRPTLAMYEALETQAKKLKQWEAIRPQLLATLEQSQNFQLLVEIHLKAKDWDAAWDAADNNKAAASGWWGRDLRVQVAAASEKHRPERAIPVYIDAAHHLIKQSGRSNYTEAARYLRRARDLFTVTQNREAWASVMAGMRQQYRHLPALQDELQKAKL